MSNVLAFPKKNSELTDKNIRRIARQYAPVPAHVTSNASLNRRIMQLQDDGFDVHLHDGRVIFTHEQSKIPMTFSEACEFQNKLKSGAA